MSITNLTKIGNESQNPTKIYSLYSYWNLLHFKIQQAERDGNVKLVRVYLKEVKSLIENRKLIVEGVQNERI